jgi:predicted deacylase
MQRTPGRKDNFSVRLGELPNGMPVLMPVMAVYGVEDGPTLLVNACTHGDEVLGADVVRRIAAELDPAKMRGAFVGVPMANVTAVGTRSRRNLVEIYPGPHDMNRVFPGNPGGVMAERAAHVLTEGFIRACDYVLDLHMASVGGAWLAYVGVPKPEECASSKVYEATIALSKAFGTPLLLEGSIVGSMVAPALQLGIPAAMAEFGVAGLIDKEDLEFGLRGVRNVLKHVGVVEGEPVLPDSQIWIKRLHRMSAQRGGFLRQLEPLGTHVVAGQPLAQIEDLTGAVLQAFAAPEAGVVCRNNTMGVVGTGDLVVYVGVSDA